MVIEEFLTIHSRISFTRSIIHLLVFFTYLAIAGSILPGKVVLGVPLSDGSRICYHCNGLMSLILLVALLAFGMSADLLSPEDICGRGIELLSAALTLSLFVSLVLYFFGCKSPENNSSAKSHPPRNFVHDWWFGVQLNPQFMGLDLKFFFVRAGMMGWFLINLSIIAKCIQDSSFTRSMILYQTFSVIYILDYFFYEEYMTSTWDIIAEKLGYMLVFGDLVWIPFTFSIQGWWLLGQRVELTFAASVSICAVFIAGYLIFRGANRQKHMFKKNPKALIWGRPPLVIGGKLLASGYWGLARHCNYLGDMLLALSFSLPCGLRSGVPYIYPVYIVILLVWRERRDEARCAEKYKPVWDEYTRVVPWRILPYVY